MVNMKTISLSINACQILFNFLTNEETVKCYSCFKSNGKKQCCRHLGKLNFMNRYITSQCLQVKDQLHSTGQNVLHFCGQGNNLCHYQFSRVMKQPKDSKGTNNLERRLDRMFSTCYHPFRNLFTIFFLPLVGNIFLNFVFYYAYPFFFLAIQKFFLFL